MSYKALRRKRQGITVVDGELVGTMYGEGPDFLSNVVLCQGILEYAWESFRHVHLYVDVNMHIPISDPF